MAQKSLHGLTSGMAAVTEQRRQGGPCFDPSTSQDSFTPPGAPPELHPCRTLPVHSWPPLGRSSRVDAVLQSSSLSSSSRTRPSLRQALPSPGCLSPSLQGRWPARSHSPAVPVLGTSQPVLPSGGRGGKGEPGHPQPAPPTSPAPRMPGTAGRDHEELPLSLSQGCVRDDPEPLVATSSWSLRRETRLREGTPWFGVMGSLFGAVSLHSFSLSTKPHSRSQLPRGSRDCVRLLGLGSAPEQPWEPLPGAGRSRRAGSQRRVWAGSSRGARPRGSAARGAVWQQLRHKRGAGPAPAHAASSRQAGQEESAEDSSRAGSAGSAGKG